MRILLTGNRGRIGSVVQRQLDEEGHEVVGYDIADGHDILNSAGVGKAIRDCDGVAHLAMLFGRSIKPENVFANGTLGTWNILQAAELHGVGRVVSYSSVNAMGIFRGEGTPDFLPIDETHECRPVTAYGISKYLGEQACRLFTQRTGVPTVCIRPPAVMNDEVIETIKEARRRDPECEWTPRNWEYGCYVHVEDLARATVLALTCPDPGHVVALVTADDVSSAELDSRRLVEKLMPTVPWRGGGEYESDPFKSLADNSLAQKVLGWKPHYRWYG